MEDMVPEPFLELPQLSSRPVPFVLFFWGGEAVGKKRRGIHPIFFGWWTVKGNPAGASSRGLAWVELLVGLGNIEAAFWVRQARLDCKSVRW